MAVTVKAICLGCDEEQLLPMHAVTLLLAAGVTTYGFQCPDCSYYTVKPAGKTMISEMGRNGVAAKVIRLPKDISEGAPDGPPFTRADLYDLALDLGVTADPLAELIPAERLPVWDETMRALERER
jgi:hypothetical protein